jgi:hypothetical protein
MGLSPKSHRRREKVKGRGIIPNWLRQFPAESARTRLAALEREQERITNEIENIREWLALYDRAMSNIPSDNGTESTPPVVDTGRERRYPSKRVVALKLLSENVGAEMEFAKIRAKLIERGDMGDSDKEKHALRVALFKAFKKGEVDRPRDGVFVVRPPSPPSPSLLTGDTDTG